MERNGARNILCSPCCWFWCRTPREHSSNLKSRITLGDVFGFLAVCVRSVKKDAAPPLDLPSVVRLLQRTLGTNGSTAKGGRDRLFDTGRSGAPQEDCGHPPQLLPGAAPRVRLPPRRPASVRRSPPTPPSAFRCRCVTYVSTLVLSVARSTRRCLSRAWLLHVACVAFGGARARACACTVLQHREQF